MPDILVTIAPIQYSITVDKTVTPFQVTVQKGLATAGVSSINGVTGAIAFTEGSNIEITASGNNFTISSTGGLTQDQADARYRLQSVALVDGDIPATITRDSELTAAIASITPASIGALTQTVADTRYRLQSTPLTDGDIPATIARDSEVSGAIAAITPANIGALTQATADARYRLQSVALTDSDIPATIARDSEVSSAIAGITTTSIGAQPASARLTEIAGLTPTLDYVIKGTGTGWTAAPDGGSGGGGVTDHGALTGLNDDDHPQYLTEGRGDLRYRLQSTALTDSDIPGTIARDSEVTSAIASHVAASDPHPNYALESSLATVATTGAYSDLSGRPTIPTTPGEVGAQPVDADLSAIAALSTLGFAQRTGANTWTLTTLATVATTGAYADLSGRPTLGTAAAESAASLRDRTTHTGTQAASTVTPVTTNLKIATGANLQVALEEADVALVNARSTGVRYGGFPTPVGGLGAGTTVNISAGHGQILNNTDATNPTYTKVFWTAKTGVAIANTGTSQTYWYVDDNSDTIKQQTTNPTRAERRTKLFLFRTSLTSGVITAIESEVNPAQQIGGIVRDLADAVGVLRTSTSDLIPSKGTGALKLAISAGGLFRVGANWASSYLDPNVSTLAAFDSGVSNNFRYAIPSGPIAVNLTDIQVANYAPGGVVTAIPGANSRVGLHFIFRFPAGNCRIVYGNAFYSNLDEAVTAIGSIDPFTLAPPSFAASGFCIGAIAATKAETDLVNARFVTTNKYGVFSGGVVAQSGALLRSNNLSDLTNVATARTNLGLTGFPKDYRINPISFTGSTTANQTVATMVFPGGTFADGDRLHILAQHSPRPSSAGTCALILELIHSGGTTTLFSNTATASQSRQVVRYVAFEAANINFHPDVSNSQPFSALGGSITRTAIDLAQQVTVRVGFTLSNAADTWWLNQLAVEHKRAVTL